MKSEWQEFLQDAGAEFNSHRVVHFGHPEHEKQVIHSGLVMTDLSHLGLISAYGEDTSHFLQGQLTNDINAIDNEHSQLSAYCTPKGRMLSNFRIFKRKETHYLRLPVEMLENTLKRLQMFTLMAKVTLEEATNALVHIGVSGQDADNKLSSQIKNLPSEIDSVTQSDGFTIIRIPGPHPRYEIYGELEAMKQLWNHLDVDGAPVGADAWSMLDIISGIPTIYPQTVEAFVPQMINLQFINGVNFKKGCYTGQEIVARMQYLGKLKRRMYLIHIDTAQPVNTGDSLYSPEGTSGQGTGTIVEAQTDPNGGSLALAVINISDAENGKLQLHDQDGPAIQVKELPYSVTATES